MSSYVYGVVISGIVGSYVPHKLARHSDVSTEALIADDVLAWSGTEWVPVATSTLPVGTHVHTGVYVAPADLTPYAPLLTPDFTNTIEISGPAPALIAHEDSVGLADTKLYINDNAWYLRTGGKDVFKWENFYSSYNFMSLANQYRTFTASAAVGNPACVVYVDATAGNIVLTLNAASDYYRNNGTYYSGAWLIFVRKDATTNTVTLTPDGAETIDGAATLAMSGLNSMVFMQAVVGGWKVISREDSTLNTNDSGWLDWPYNATYAWGTPAAYPVHTTSDTWETMRYRKINKIVYIRGSFAHSVGVSTLEATLPEGYRPPSDVLIPARTYNSADAIENNALIIHADGTVYEEMSMSSGYSSWHVYGFFMVD